MTNNSFHKEKFNNIFKEKKSENVCNTIEIQKKYKNFIDSQKNAIFDFENCQYLEGKYNSIDNSNIIENNISLKNDFN